MYESEEGSLFPIELGLRHVWVPLLLTVFALLLIHTIRQAARATA